MNENTKKLVTAALMAALTCVATMFIMIPSPYKGYINLGDCFVLTAGWVLSPLYGALAAGIGSGLADMFAGYVIYAPATFVIKALMALCACFGFQILHKTFNTLFSRVISGVLAEVVMVLGYFIFESFLYGPVASAVNIPANCIQGVAGICIGIGLIKILKKMQNDKI